MWTFDCQLFEQVEFVFHGLLDFRRSLRNCPCDIFGKYRWTTETHHLSLSDQPSSSFRPLRLSFFARQSQLCGRTSQPRHTIVCHRDFAISLPYPQTDLHRWQSRHMADDMTSKRRWGHCVGPQSREFFAAGCLSRLRGLIPNDASGLDSSWI